MLTEAHLLQQALEEAGVKPPPQHPRVKRPGSTTGPCLRVRLAPGGIVAAVEDVTVEEWPGLWTVMEGNHNSFPVVRVAEPLFRLPDVHGSWERLYALDEKKDSRDVALALAEILEAEQELELSSKGKSFWKRLAEVKAAELRACAQQGDGPEASALAELGRLFQQSAHEPAVLLEEITRQAVRRLREARLVSAEAVRLLVVGNLPGFSRTRKLQLAFDLLPDAAFPRGIYTGQIRRALIELLPVDLDASAGALDHPASACALTGRRGHLQVGPFPKVQLPVLNREFPLFSMFSDARCNFRFGLTDSDIIPVSAEASRKIQDALTYIVAPERKGQTWESVASGLFDVRDGRKQERMDLLIAYVEGRPEIPEELATLFGTEQEEVEKLFETHAESVCAALRKQKAEKPESRLNLFVLRKASEGQAQVVLAERPTVDTVFDGLKRWSEAVGNLPSIEIPFRPERKGQPAQFRAPQAPFLSRTVQLFSEEWLRGGLRANKVGGVTLGEVLDVFLRHPKKGAHAARRLLDLTIRRSGWLILGFQAAARSGNRTLLQHFGAHRRWAILYVVAFVGILLDAVGRKKETYMNESAFLVGRLLALADSLHVQYCKAKREGDVPPQLIGNALVPVAAESPRAAIDRLRERLTVYQAWATQASSSEDGDKLAGWLLGQIGRVCRELSEAGIPSKTDEAARAELFLGYMAREPRRSEAEAESQDTKEDA